MRYEPGSTQEEVRGRKIKKNGFVVGDMPILRRKYILGAGLILEKDLF